MVLTTRNRGLRCVDGLLADAPGSASRQQPFALHVQAAEFGVRRSRAGSGVGSVTLEAYDASGVATGSACTHVMPLADLIVISDIAGDATAPPRDRDRCGASQPALVSDFATPLAHRRDALAAVRRRPAASRDCARRSLEPLPPTTKDAPGPAGRIAEDGRTTQRAVAAAIVARLTGLERWPTRA